MDSGVRICSNRENICGYNKEHRSGSSGKVGEESK